MTHTIELQPIEDLSTHHRGLTHKDKPKDEQGGDFGERDVEQTVVVPDSDDESHDVYPEGGLRAYLVVLGGFFGCIVNLGVLNSIGAVQMWVSGHQLKDYLALTISWIFSIYLALTYMLAIIAGPIFDRYGPRHIMIVSALLMFGGLMGVASAAELWQFALGFICLGAGNGLGMSPLISILSHWFFEKRGTMVGFATLGGLVGGLVFPLMLRYAYAKYGFEWAIRILAFTTLGCMVVATLLVKERFRRLPPQKSDEQRQILKWNQLKSKLSFKFIRELDRRYWILVAGAFFAELSLVLIMTYFSTYCVAKGQTESTALLLVTVWNATGIPGRIVPNFVSDYLGRFNMNVAMILGYTIVIWVIWLPLGHLIGALYAFAAIGGFFSGSILLLLPACLAQITPVREIGIRYGVVNFVLSIANLFGVPIALAIIGQGKLDDYDKFVIFVACLSTAGLVLWYVDRGAVAGYKLNIRV